MERQVSTRKLTDKEKLLHALGDKNLPCPICGKLVKGMMLREFDDSEITLNFSYECDCDCHFFTSSCDCHSSCEDNQILMYWVSDNK